MCARLGVLTLSPKTHMVQDGVAVEVQKPDDDRKW